MPITRQTTHTSLKGGTAFRYVLWLSLAFLGGILLASRKQTAAHVWLVLAAALLLLAILVRSLIPRIVRRPVSGPTHVFSLVLVALTLFALGAYRYQVTLPKVGAGDLRWYNDGQGDVLVVGTVVDPPEKSDSYTSLRLAASEVNVGAGWVKVRGVFLAHVSADRNWQYGDVVRVRGHLTDPSESPALLSQDFLTHQGVHSFVANAEVTRLPFQGGDPFLRRVYLYRDQLAARIGRLFSGPEAALMNAILLGDTTGMSLEQQQSFKAFGLFHVLTIPGFGLAVLAGFFVIAFRRFLGWLWGMLAACMGILLYVVMLGASPPLIRTAVLVGLAFFSVLPGKRQYGILTLTAAAAAMAAFDPGILWDASFLVPCAAALGLILYAQPLQEWIAARLSPRMSAKTADQVSNLCSGFLLFPLAAQLTVLPILVSQYQSISAVALLAGLLLLPVLPAVLLLGGLAELLGFLSVPAGQFTGWAAWPFAAYILRGVELLDRLPHLTLHTGKFSWILALLFYVFLLALALAREQLKPKLRTTFAAAAALGLFGVLTTLVWAAAYARPDGRLHLIFLNAGSADAILIQTPGGRNLLINGGQDPTTLSEALGKYISPLEPNLDWLVVASTQEAEVGALPQVLNSLHPNNVLWAGQIEASGSSLQLDRMLAEEHIPVTLASDHAALELGPGASLEVLAVSPRGAVLLVQWDGFRALLPIGSNFDTLQQLQNGEAVGPVTLLLLGDSGYGPSNPPEWIDALRPQLTILSVAAGDPEGLPDPNVIKSVSVYGTLLRTDQNGWIEVATDGTRLWIDAQTK